jgi:hypothetical protein
MTRALICLFLLATPAFAQVNIRVDVALPTISFEVAPPLVVVQPGVQVVEDFDDEVFFVDSWYWCRRDGRWFRTRSHRGGWVVVEDRAVPVTLVKLPPGQYRRWKPVKVKVEHGHGNGKHGKGR